MRLLGKRHYKHHWQRFVMRVLIVQTRFPPALGGQEKHVYQLVKYLALDGYDVTVYTTSSLSSEDVYSFSLRPPFHS